MKAKVHYNRYRYSDLSDGGKGCERWVVVRDCASIRECFEGWRKERNENRTRSDSTWIGPLVAAFHEDGSRCFEC
jgi:hypothetical protein